MKLTLALLTLAASISAPLHAQRYEATQTAERITLTDNESIRAVISPAVGAELCGLEIKFRGSWREILYRACDYTPIQGWTGRAPWLWPATGRNFPANVKPNEAAVGSSWDYQGKRYPMPIHGFARDLPWKVASVNATASGARAVLTLADSPKTRAMYPFGWQLTLEYLIAHGELSIEFRVRASAQNTAPMPFSTGNHITFRMPLVEGSDPLKTTLQSPSSIEYVKNGSAPTGEKRPVAYDPALPLSRTPVGQAVTLGGYTKGIWMTLTDPAGLAVTLQHTPSSLPPEVCLFNMWGDARSGYYSPEPWVGLQNSLVSGNGLIQLPPAAEWQWRLGLTALDLNARPRRDIPAR
ncbi:MAG: hypothetical protein J0L64_17755 [Acidobacteria bacterium]|nr:hypothetical protein [Acidobacteriota bacterium]